jgi:hypothetical protein
VRKPALVAIPADESDVIEIAEDSLRQGDPLFNVPTPLVPQRPRFVFGSGEEVRTETYDDFPENPPSTEIVVEARFGALGMIVTPTCHVSEGEKDQDVVAVVPVEPLNLVVADLATARNILAGKNVPLHMFAATRALRRSSHRAP